MCMNLETVEAMLKQVMTMCSNNYVGMLCAKLELYFQIRDAIPDYAREEVIAKIFEIEGVETNA